jgi:HlyD family secretion protein
MIEIMTRERFTIRALLIATAVATNLGGIPRCMAADSIVKALGVVEPREVVDVNAQIGGTILRFGEETGKKDKSIDFGSHVKKGDVLAELDSKIYVADLNKAKADCQKAETTLQLAKSKVSLADLEFQRAKRTAAEKGGDTFSVDSARAALEVAQNAMRDQAAEVELAHAALQRAEISVAYCTIKAPCDGIILDRRINPGQIVAVSPGAPSLFMIAKDLKHMVVWASVSESDIGRIAKGQTARLTFEALPGRALTGKVTQIRMNAAQNRNRVYYTVVIDPDVVDDKLLPYLTADVEIDATSQPPAQDEPHQDAPEKGKEKPDPSIQP